MNTSPIIVAVSTSVPTNEHLKAKAPKVVKEAAAAAEPRGDGKQMVMSVTVPTAKKAAEWLAAEANRLRESEKGDNKLARRLNTVANRIPGLIETAVYRADKAAKKAADEAAEQPADEQPAEQPQAEQPQAEPVTD